MRAPIHTRITGRRSWLEFRLREMWQFRRLLRILAVRDVKLRYRQTALGAFGVMLAPLLNAGVLSFVFGEVAGLPSEGIPYVAFAYAGFLGWNVFAGIVARASGALLANTSMVSKIYVPRLLLPLSGTIGALVDFAIASILMVLMMVGFGLAPGPQILLVPLWLIGILAIGLGVGTAAGAAIVYFRDIAAATSAALQALLYLTPVAYSAEAVPARFESLYRLNPLGGLIEGMRWSLLGTDPPSAGRVGLSLACGGLVLVCGCLAFNRLERGLADVI